MTDTSKLLDCAIETAQAAGRHAASNCSRRANTVLRTSHDVKLELDLECQKIAAGIISETFPDHSFLGEENTGHNASKDSRFLWVVDPIDGTVNFSHGFPFWCSSVAVQDRKGNTIAAAVFAPHTDELYTASLDEQAKLNGSTISVSKTSQMTDAMILTGLDQDIVSNLPPMYFAKTIALASQKVRVAGAAALDLCRVAAGQSDGYFEAGIFTWDIAAGGLIVEKAGGKSEMLAKISNQPHRKAFMATNGRIHEMLKSILKDGIASIQGSKDQH